MRLTGWDHLLDEGGCPAGLAQTLGPGSCLLPYEDSGQPAGLLGKQPQRSYNSSIFMIFFSSLGIPLTIFRRWLSLLIPCESK